MAQQIDAAANLGKLLQIVYTDGIVNQISEDFRDWEMVTKKKVSDEAARSVNFMLQTALGARAIGWSPQGASAVFPTSQQVTASEKSAGFNEVFATIELEYDLWDRALSAPHKYIEPLALEITSKGIAQKRRLSIDLHGDGTGLIGTTHASTSAAVVNTTEIKVTFADNGDGVRYCEFGDAISFYNSNGTELTFTTADYFLVIEKDRDANTVTVQGYTSGNVAESGGQATTTATEITASKLCYRKDQTTKADLSAPVTTEYNDLTEVMPGLETLFADDGRLIHGITMRGATAGTHYDCSGQPFDMSFIQKGMDKVKTIVGQGAYKYKQALSAPETITALISAQEDDRRLISINDDKRGFKGFGYQHGNDQVAFMETEFTRGNRVWILPEGAKEKGVLELHGKDFKDVKVGGQDMFLKNDSNGYSPNIQKFMFGYLALLSRHPAAGLQLNNFTV
tara:strand:- start:3706 stop:5064 length:1359 start_codon:yes stop_codon:yes gene_type:complete